MSEKGELQAEELELRARLKSSSGKQLDRITEQLHQVRKQLYGPDRGPQPIAPEIHQLIARIRSEIDGHIGT